ncbi:MAG TPA: hypothetical protein VNO55_07160 [Polyangia bacterium]|nr:hypothetical protein [Polyangia bacterium]
MFIRIAFVAGSVLLALTSSGCVLKSTHCKFVSDVGSAASEFSSLAEAKGDPSQKALAKQLNTTVASEQQGSCK